jgi:hypothetical protein
MVGGWVIALVVVFLGHVAGAFFLSELDCMDGHGVGVHRV